MTDLTIDAMRREINSRFDVANRDLNNQQAERNRRFQQNVTVPQWIITQAGIDGDAWQRGHVKVIWSLAIEQDDQPWLHVSVSREHTPAEPVILPSYFDMKRAKALVIGTDRFAYSVWAPTDEHVNINPGVLHLFAPMGETGPSLPDFTKGLQTL
jgi:hypothetical protein